jgi:hypothetical protein
LCGYSKRRRRMNAVGVRCRRVYYRIMRKESAVGGNAVSVCFYSLTFFVVERVHIFTS